MLPHETRAAAAPSGGRQAAYDCMRLVAIFGVIALHERFPATGLLDPGTGIRFMVRWCVPFFFMLTGYFLPERSGFAAVDLRRLTGVVALTLIANLIWLPAGLYLGGFSFFSSDLLVDGTWFHLWFLNSMLLGLIFLLVVPQLFRRPGIVTAFSLLLVALFFAVDLLGVLGVAGFAGIVSVVRQFQAAPFMWLGFVLARRHSGWSGSGWSGGLVALFGMALCLAELFLFSMAGVSQYDRVLPFGALVMAIGILASCAYWPQSRFIDGLAYLGRTCTLPVYIFHPIALAVVHVVTARLPLPQWVSGVVAISLCFLATLMGAFLLQRWLPSIAAIVTGRLPPLGEEGAIAKS